MSGEEYFSVDVLAREKLYDLIADGTDGDSFLFKTIKKGQ